MPVKFTFFLKIDLSIGIVIKSNFVINESLLATFI
jgi:hypothetical protein